jgi:hypothetical protein
VRDPNEEKRTGESCMMKTYYINQGLFKPPLEVNIETPPPCLFCDQPVTSPSMDGPLVCGSCDCGRNRDGSKWTDEEREHAWNRRRKQIAKYREAPAKRQNDVSWPRKFQAGVIPGEALHPDTHDFLASFDVVPAGGSFAIKAHYIGSKLVRQLGLLDGYQSPRQRASLSSNLQS